MNKIVAYMSSSFNCFLLLTIIIWEKFFNQTLSVFQIVWLLCNKWDCYFVGSYIPETELVWTLQIYIWFIFIWIVFMIFVNIDSIGFVKVYSQEQNQTQTNQTSLDWQVN